MGLKQNCTATYTSFTRHFGVSIINTNYLYLAPANLGIKQDFFLSNFSNKESVPAGARHPVAIYPAIKPGGLASRNETLFVTQPFANGVKGLPTQGDTSINLVVSDATGNLIVSGSGSTAIGISAIAQILSVASAEGQSLFSVSVPAVTIGALAGIAATSSISVSSSTSIKAKGLLEGLSTNETLFSPSNLASAVWNALGAQYTAAGTMGEKLNSVGAASNPWSSVIEDGLTAEQILRILLAVASGETTIDTSGAQVIVKFKSLNGLIDRVTATMDGSERVDVTTIG